MEGKLRNSPKTLQESKCKKIQVQSQKSNIYLTEKEKRGEKVGRND